MAIALNRVRSLRRARRRAGTRIDLGLIIPLVVTLGMLFICFLLPLLAHIPGPNQGSLSKPFVRPLSPGHLLGTDQLGNDVLSQCLYGGRVAIEIAVLAVGLGYLVGGSLGIAAGYFRGWTDALIMRFMDAILAFPSLILALAIVTFLGANRQNIIIAIAFFTVPSKARLARSATIRIRERDYLLASRIMGKRSRYIILHHVVANVAPPLMTFAMLNIAVAMIIEAGLSYLGLGVPPPTPNWGALISEGQQYLAAYPWIAFAPSVFLFVTVLALNMLGDALRVRLKA